MTVHVVQTWNIDGVTPTGAAVFSTEDAAKGWALWVEETSDSCCTITEHELDPAWSVLPGTADIRNGYRPAGGVDSARLAALHEAEAIVLALAEADPVVYQEWAETRDCALCGDPAGYRDRHSDPDCPWVMARSYVEKEVLSR